MAAICHVVLCMFAVGFQTDDEKLAGLLKTLENPDAKVRIRALAQIGSLPSKPKSAVPILFAFLKTEKSPAVREQTIAVIGSISFIDEKMKKRPLEQIDEKILEGIAAFIADESIEGRRAAIGALRYGGAKSKFAVPKLIEATKDQDRSVKCAAMTCLMAIGPDAAPALPLIRMELKRAEKALKDEDDPIRKKYSPTELEIIRDTASMAILAIEKKEK